MKKFTQIFRIMCLIVVLILAAVAAGCGDEESSSSEQGTTSATDTASVPSSDSTEKTGDDTGEQTGSVSKSQFIARADAICQKSRERFEAKFLSLANQAEAAESVRKEIPRQKEEENQTKLVTTVLVPTYEDQTEQIRALGAPKGGEEAVASFLRATQDALDEASTEPIEYLGQQGQKFSEATELASAYGMSVCAQTMDLTRGLAIR